MTVRRLVVPAALLRSALEHLRLTGRTGVESIVLLLGRRSGCTTEAQTLVLAEPPGVTRRFGFLRLTERWMLRLTEYCELSSQAVVVQIHSHPGKAWHSDTDEHHLIHGPAIISLVVPNFGRSRVDCDPEAWAAYIGQPGGGFEPTNVLSVVQAQDVVGRVVTLSEEGWRDAES